MAAVVNLANGCDIRPSLTTMEPRADGGPPVIEYWVRPKGVAPDPLFALLCGDVSAPVTFGVNRFVSQFVSHWKCSQGVGGTALQKHEIYFFIREAVLSSHSEIRSKRPHKRLR